MEGVECFNIALNLPVAVAQELQWYILVKKLIYARLLAC